MHDITSMIDTLPESDPSALSQSTSSSLLMTVNTEEYNKAKACLSTIQDPLWYHVCEEIITIMGPASLLKLWNSHLGEVSSNGTSIEIHCRTEEASLFVQEYAFVILGCLKPYFPTLKKLNVTTRDSLV